MWQAPWRRWADIVEEVIMNLEPRLASILVEELPSYLDFVNDDGSLTMVLQQALYGLVESSKL